MGAGFYSLSTMHRLILLLLLAATSAAGAEKTVTWTNPTSNTDGSPLPAEQITRTTVVWGSSAEALTESQVVNGSLTTATIDLAPGSWFVAARTTANGQDSGLSNIAQVEILPPAPNPPSNLTVQAQTAYVIKQTRDNIAVVAVGSVPADTRCDAARGVIVDGAAYHVVPRDRVSWAGSVRSEIVVSLCG